MDPRPALDEVKESGRAWWLERRERFRDGASLGICVAGTAALFVCFAQYIDHTGNLVAWGKPGLGVVSKSPLALFTYEAAHTTSAFSALLLGAWLLGYRAFDRYLTGDIGFASSRSAIVAIWLFGIVVFLVAYVVLAGCGGSDLFVSYCKAPLFSIHGSEFILFQALSYLNSTLIAFCSSLAVPAVIALGLLAKSSYRRRPGSGLAVALTCPLLLAPLMLASYLSLHYQCFGSPSVYEGVLDAISPVLIFGPLGVQMLAERLARK